MAMTATYTTFAGMVVHQRKNGVDTELISDPLGSVVKTKDASGNETSRTEYWPYGEVQSSTGSNPTPFGFVGTLGYYRDLATRLYVRARYLRPDKGRWQTVDPLWPDETAYGYVNGNATTYVDPSGLWWINIIDCNTSERQRIIDVFNDRLNPANLAGYIGCLKDCNMNFGGSHTGAVGDCVADHLGRIGPGNGSFTVKCGKTGQAPCDKKNRCAFTFGNTITLCPGSLVKPSDGGKCGRLSCTLAHELIHLCHRTHNGDESPFRCVNQIPLCENSEPED